METETENLVLEQLRAIRKDIAELKDGLAGLHLEISAIGKQVAALREDLGPTQPVA